MEELNVLIKQINEKHYNGFLEEQLAAKADKTAALLCYARHMDYGNTKTAQLLNLNRPALYTLKSRLKDRLHLYLVNNFNAGEAHNHTLSDSPIPHMYYSYPTELFQFVLLRHERMLKEQNQFSSLLTVYKYKQLLYPEQVDGISMLQSSTLQAMENQLTLNHLSLQYYHHAGRHILSKSEDELTRINQLYKKICSFSTDLPSIRLTVQTVRLFHSIFIQKPAKNTAGVNDMCNLLAEIKTTFAECSTQVDFCKYEHVIQFLELALHHYYDLPHTDNDLFSLMDNHIEQLITHQKHQVFAAIYFNMRTDYLVQNGLLKRDRKSVV